MSNPVTFIVGPPRSGTTLLLDLLNLHPEVAGFEREFYPFHHDLRLFPHRSADHFHLLTGDANFALQSHYQQHIHSLCQSRQKKHCVIKISTLSLQVDYARALVPTARFIQLVRDGRDTACSMEDLRQALENRQGHPRILGPAPDPSGLFCAENFGIPLLSALASWHFHTTRSYLNLRFLGADNFLRLKYEDLVEQPQATLAKILSFMGINESAALNSRLHDISNQPNVQKPVELGFSTTQHTHERRERYKNNLPIDLRTIAAPLLEQPMVLLGYAADSPTAGEIEQSLKNLRIDSTTWANFVESETQWFSRQLKGFAPENLLRQPSTPTPESRVLLIDGAHFGHEQHMTSEKGTGALSFVAKQERRFTFADPEAWWPGVAKALHGKRLLKDITQPSQLGWSMRILTTLHQKGFVAYI